MRISPRMRANRRNSRGSTGPRTAAGKARVAKNALRHGLNIPVALDAGLSDEIERLSRLIAGKDRDPLRMQRARQLAEAQVDILRVRRVRYVLLADSSELMKELATRESCSKFHRVESMVDGEAAVAELEYFPDGGQRTFEEGLDLLAKLARLDRYERRALSRRKSVIRNLDVCPLTHETGEGAVVPTGMGVVMAGAMHRTEPE